MGKRVEDGCAETSVHSCVPPYNTFFRNADRYRYVFSFIQLDGKLLADYAEEDFIAVAKYEREVAAKNDKRTVYKNMLEDEQASISKHIDDTVNGLDKSAFELFQIKYKYDAAIDQERLKIFRLSKTLDDDERQKRQIELRR